MYSFEQIKHIILDIGVNSTKTQEVVEYLDMLEKSCLGFTQLAETTGAFSPPLSPAASPVDFASGTIIGFFLSIFLILFAVKNQSSLKYTTVTDILIFRMVYPMLTAVCIIPLIIGNTILRFSFACFGRIGFKEIFNNSSYAIEKDMEHNIMVHVGPYRQNEEYQHINNCDHDCDH